LFFFFFGGVFTFGFYPFMPLKTAAGFFRHELGARLNLRRIPELDLRMDESLERGDHIMRLIRKVEQEDAERAKHTEENSDESQQ
jgi:hypothetical protein